MKSINIGHRKIGLGHPAYLVAEIGINHNGDIKLAEETIIAAKESGADAVKFQNYKTEDFIPIRSLEYEYISQGKPIREFQYDMFKRYELNAGQIIHLKEFCDKNDIDFHSTPTNVQGVDLLKKIGVSVLKNGSDYLTNLELIEYMGKSGLPTVLSTGMALISEIDEAVKTFKSTGNKDLILLHCTSQYPTPPQDINLRKIKTLYKTFNVIVGFSDHSEGSLAAVGAIFCGASWIEKHFTLDKELPGPDHRFSADLDEFAHLAKSIRHVEQLFGDSELAPTELEKISRESFRLSCCTSRDLQRGKSITQSDIIFIRPGTGFSPNKKEYLIGRKVTKDIPAFTVITQDCLD